jgi:hypothetical protein
MVRSRSVWGRSRTCSPALSAGGIGVARDVDPRPGGVRDREPAVAEARVGVEAAPLDAAVGEPVAPVAERVRRHREGDGLVAGLPDPPGVGVRVGEDREGGARRAGRVAEVEVVLEAVLAVHRPAEQAEAERLAVEVGCGTGVADDPRDVVEPGGVREHAPDRRRAGKSVSVGATARPGGEVRRATAAAGCSR